MVSIDSRSVPSGTMKDLVRFNSANENMLTQSEDLKKFNIKDFKIVSKRKPSVSQVKNLLFANDGKATIRPSNIDRMIEITDI